MNCLGRAAAAGSGEGGYGWRAARLCTGRDAWTWTWTWTALCVRIGQAWEKQDRTPLASLQHHMSDGERVKAARSSCRKDGTRRKNKSARCKSIATDDCHTKNLTSECEHEGKCIEYVSPCQAGSLLRTILLTLFLTSSVSIIAACHLRYPMLDLCTSSLRHLCVLTLSGTLAHYATGSQGWWYQMI